MLILASNSQTRANLLKKYKIEFKQIGCNFNEEKLTFSDPKTFVYSATLGKLNSFLSQHKKDNPILCADTVVTCSGRILRKAKNKQEAREILDLQSGNLVDIITCMILKKESLTLCDISVTTYEFKKFDDKKLEIYLNSDEWIGKAGACMVEGFCRDYILSVKGYESTAMGLCVEKLIPFLDD